MRQIGYVKGMRHEVAEPVQYYLQLDESEMDLNEGIGQFITLEFLAKKKCMACGRDVKKLYNSGYCYPCFTTLAECDLCIVKPHECHFHLGTCRDEAFGETHCMIPHFVYLAVSSGIKVGLTRKNRELTRWVDQGAVQAIPIAQTPTRKLAGELEMAVAEFLPDKTDWRKMLRGDIDPVDLQEIRREVLERLPESFQEYILDEQEIRNFQYPVQEAPTSVKSLSFDKEPVFRDKLIGIKGQYILLQSGVINIKKHCGYRLAVEFA